LEAKNIKKGKPIWSLFLLIFSVAFFTYTTENPFSKNVKYNRKPDLLVRLVNIILIEKLLQHLKFLFFSLSIDKNLFQIKINYSGQNHKKNVVILMDKDWHNKIKHTENG
jgi:hypothetical protein